MTSIHLERMYVIVAMTIDGYIGVLIMNVVNSIVRFPIKDFIGLLTLTLVIGNVRSPMQSSTTKTLTNQLLDVRVEHIAHCDIPV